MIRISKPKPPAFLSDAADVWVLETQAAIKHYESGITAAFTFERYRDARLKKELEKVFPKCAYCESVYNASSDGDVEHFRPKGRVEEKVPPTPGYYWLANDWDNLMLACQHCNQRRKHEKKGDIASRPKSWGKMDQFPLKNELVRVRAHTADKKAFAKEEKQRWLLHPCKDFPEKHFAYDPNTAAQIYRTEKASKSADIYVLWRPKLVRARNERRIEVFARIEIVKQELDRYNENPTAKNKKYFQSHLDRLLELADDAQPYSGMARYFIRNFLKENKIS